MNEGKTRLAAMAGSCLALAATGCAGAPRDVDREASDAGSTASPVVVTSEPTTANPSWYSGSFRYLPSIDADLFTHVTTRIVSSTYVVPDPTRQAALATMTSSIFAALDASLAAPATGDWCRAQADANAAGYALQRIHDTATGRWYLHAYDTTGSGGAYLWIDPEPGRNIVIESPHSGTDTGAYAESARLFNALSARALLTNGAHRCASPLDSGCTGTTEVCTGDDDPYRASDVTHASSSAFFAFHAALDGRYGARFAQMHENVSSGELMIASDGTTTSSNPNAVSVAFARALSPNVAQSNSAGHVNACQAGYSGLCGTYNVAGRFTNGAPDACDGARVRSVNAGRFLHLEQDATMTDTTCEARGRCWTSVRDALLSVWGSPCKFNGCSLGPAQAAAADCACGSACGGACTPSCANKTCGDDGCGGSCGTCASGQTCTSSGTCVTSCTPSCAGKTCGDDGCGGSCGTCPSGQTCVSGACVTSTPTVDVVLCSALTLNAGSLGGSDDVACSGTNGALATVDGRIVAWNEPTSSSAPKTSADASYVSPVPAASVTGLRLLVAYDGDDATEPLWYWYARNVSGTWDVIGDSSFAGNWVTTTHAFTIANPSRYVDAQNRITIRFTTSTSNNSAELDRMVVEVTH